MELRREMAGFVSNACPRSNHPIPSSPLILNVAPVMKPGSGPTNEFGEGGDFADPARPAQCPLHTEI